MRIQTILALPLLSVALTSLSAAAQTGAPLTADEFEAITTGRTLTYAQGGVVYGIEQYLPGRQVVWAFSGDECRKGTWYQQDDNICFVYSYDPTPQCWLFVRTGTGSDMTARFMGENSGPQLSVVAETKDPLACLGPDVGV